MPRAKTYEPHCPAYNCRGGYASKLQQVTAEDVHITPDILARKKTGDVIFRCNYCGFVWFQSSSSHPGFNPTPAGFYNNFRNPDVFTPEPNWKIREENTSDYWNERR